MTKNKRVKADAYEWQELAGLAQIVEFVQGTERSKTRVEITDGPEGGAWGRYGTYLRYVQEAVEFENGTIFLLASVGEWGGTFASHDEIYNRFYKLIPKT